MLVYAVRLVPQNTLLKNLQFIRSHSVPSLAHFTPYFSDSGSEDLGVDPKDGVVSADRCRENCGSELSSSEVAEILRTMHKEPLSALRFFSQLKENGYTHCALSYLAVIKILCHWGMYRKLRSFFVKVITMKMEERCFEVSELFDAMVEDLRTDGSSPLVRAFDQLVKGYVTLGMFDEGLNILFQMKRHGVGPSLFSCNSLMKGLIRHRKYDAVVALFEQLKVLGISPNVYTYGALVKAYSRMGRLEEAGRVFFEMEEAKLSPDAFTCAAYLEGLCTNGRSDIAYEILRAWERENAPIDAYAYAVVNQGFVGENKLHIAESVLHDLEKSCLSPSEMRYRALIRGYCDCGDIDKALDIHSAMEAKGIKTNCLILTSILQCLCKKGLLSKAVEQFGNFRDVGVFLDGVSYNVAIDALCKSGKLKEAFELFDEMKSKKLVPDVVHYTTLISGICLHGDIFDAGRLFGDMLEDGLKPDVITYNVLAGGLARLGLVEKVRLLLDAMKEESVIPSPATHNAVIEGLCFSGKVEEAESYFDDLEDKSLENYASMVNGYSKSNNAIKGYRLFLWLSRQGLLISKNSRSKLLNSLCLEEKYDEAIEMFDIVLSSGDVPNKKMYSDLIASLCNAEPPEYMKRARWLFDDMFERGLSPDLITYTIMLNGYCRKNCLREALDLFSDMKGRGVCPDVITYTVLLDGHCKIISRVSRKCPERLEKVRRVASKYWCEMKEAGLKPDVVSYTALIDSRCKSDNLDDAVSLFEEMIGQGLRPDTVTYTALMSGYCKRGDVGKALALKDEMLSEGVEVNARAMATLRGGIVKIVVKSVAEEDDDSTKEMTLVAESSISDKMSGDIQNTRHAHSPWSVMNPPDHFAAANGTAMNSRPSPRKVELQGPRPTALKVNKDSYKIRKPPIHPPQNQQENREKREEGNHQEHKPVIIYAVSPKVIHTTVSDFMSVVQRLTGPDVATSSSAGGGGDVSPAARLASIERTINSPPGSSKPNDQFSLMMNSGLRDVNGNDGRNNSGLLDDILGDYCRIPAADVDGAGNGTRGILSPAPGSMPPPISPGFFTTAAALDPFSVGGGSNPFGLSPSAAGFCWSPAMVSPSPTSASFDIFNPFFDF